MEEPKLTGAEILGEGLMQARKNARIRQSQIARKLGYKSDRNITDYEAGARSIKLWEFVCYLQNCGESPPDFLAELLEKIPEGTDLRPMKSDESGLIGSHTPAEFIGQFQLFLQKNRHLREVEKILKTPESFTPSDLAQLRRRFEQAPGAFSEENLRRAYFRPDIDLISLIRHLLKGEELLDQTDRADRAIQRVREKLLATYQRPESKPLASGRMPKSKAAESGKKLSPEQEKWLKAIRDFLRRELLLSESDFGLPFFADKGLNKKQVAPLFGEGFVAMVNEAVCG